MARTQIKGTQVEDGSVQRDDLNTTIAGQAVIRKIIPGTGITLTYTGVDSGTGDVTINATGGGGGASDHEDLTGIQGGTIGEHYHLTADQAAFSESVVITEPLSGNVLRFNGTNWVEDEDVLPLTSTTNRAKTGVLVPFYVYPANVYTNPVVNGLLDLMRRYQNVAFLVVVNANSGPGVTVDANYAALVKRLQGAGATVVGYVSTDYTGVSASVVKANVLQWRTLYPSIQGIFLDEMSDIPGNEAYYTDLTSYCHKRGFFPVVGNPGATVPESYLAQKTSDIIVVVESLGYPTEATVSGNYAGGFADYNFASRAAIVYQAPYQSASIDMLKKYCGWIYVTGDTVANPYDTISGYLEPILMNLSSSGQGSTAATIDLGTLPVYATSVQIADSSAMVGDTYVVSSAPDSDEYEMDGMVCSGYCQVAGSITVFVHAVPGPLKGQRKVTYRKVL